MAILITGGAGYIGSHVVLAALEAGYSVMVADNLSTGRRDLVDSRADFIKGDIGDPNFVEQLFANHMIEAVLHFAGSIIVPESVENPLLYYRNNTAATRTLLEAAVEAGIPHFIFSSTAAVYGDPATIPVKENAALAPLSPYGTSKLMSEWMLTDAAAAHDIRYVALRYFNVAGADPERRTGQSTPNATHLIKVASQAALGERSHLAIFGEDYDTPDGTGVRDYIHVSDLASAHIAALRYLEKGGASDVFNCGYGRGFSVKEVTDMVKKVSGTEFDVRMEPRRAGDSPKVVASVDKIHAAMDWSPKWDDLETIVRHALSWERKLYKI